MTRHVEVHSAVSKPRSVFDVNGWHCPADPGCRPVLDLGRKQLPQCLNAVKEPVRGARPDASALGCDVEVVAFFLEHARVELELDRRCVSTIGGHRDLEPGGRSQSICQKLRHTDRIGRSVVTDDDGDGGCDEQLAVGWPDDSRQGDQVVSGGWLHAGAGPVLSPVVVCVAMSLKYFVEKVSPCHYVLPRTGRMKVDAHAFFSDALYERSEESMWQQLEHAASYEGVIGAYLMPDAHVGLRSSGRLRSRHRWNDHPGRLGLRHLVRRHLHESARAARGRRRQPRATARVDQRGREADRDRRGTHRPRSARRTSARQTDEILRYGAKAVGVRADLCERQYIPIPDDVDLTEISRALRQGAAAARLGRRRQPLRRDAGRSRRRARSG